MQALDLKRLRYFVTVARLGSFTRAADALNMAQPPLSQRVQELEEQLGVRLLNRESRPIALTPAGEALFEQAVALLRASEAMVTSMRRFVPCERPRFTFGAVTASFPHHLAQVIRRFRQAMPDVDVHLLELNGREQAAALRDRRIDAGIGRTWCPADGVHHIVLRHEPLVLALPEDHALAQDRGAVSLQALRDEPMLVYVNGPRPSLADAIVAQLQARGIERLRTQEVDHYDSALLMVAAGCGVTIVPDAARRAGSPGLAFRPLVEALTAPIVLSHRSGEASPALRALYRALADLLCSQGHAVPKELAAA